jgi:hypothetical protein
MATTIAGRVEAQITIPAGVTLSATNVTGGGPTSIPVVAGNYYMTDLCAHIQAQLNALRTPATWTVALDTTTGLVSFNWTGATSYTITWVTTALRDLLGFAANFGPIAQGVATSGSKQALGVWIPNCTLKSDVDSKQAPTENDQRETESPGGDVYSLAGTDKYAHTNLEWTHVSLNRIWISEETTPNQSYERFYNDAIRGNGNTWLGIARPLKIYDHRGAVLGQAHSVSGWKLSGAPKLASLRMSVDGLSAYVHVQWPRLVSAG